MSTMEGGGPPIDWDGLVPHIDHPARESIVEAIRWVGPLSAPDLKAILEEPEFHLSYISYHLRALVEEGVLSEVGGRTAGASVETLYYFPVR
jgi:hypothetical protein